MTTNGANVAIGVSAGVSITTGTQNTFVGGLAGDAMTTSNNNTAIGYAALTSGATGYENFAGGVAALNDCTTGYRNVAIGHIAGYAINAGNNNTLVGFQAGTNITTGANLQAFGKDAAISGSPGGAATTGSNAVYIADENITAAYIQVDWTISSDERDKTDFTALDLGLDFVKGLAPVTYKWDKRSNYINKNDPAVDLDKVVADGTHKEDWLDIGFKAQEVEALEKAAGYKMSDKTNLTTSLTHDGKQYGIQYNKFVPILVKAVQELSDQVSDLKDQLDKCNCE